MLGRVVVENGVKKIVPLTADCGSGNPVGTVIAVYSNKVPNGYLPCNGVQFDTAQFPVLYALLEDDHTPDLRECTLKGIGESGRTVGAHVKAGGLAVGEFIDDRVQDFRLRTTEGAGGDGDRLAMGTNAGTQATPRIYTLSTNMRNGATTEVKAVGVNWCIKATSGINENQADNVLSALSPVDVVALNNVHSVTSNAVARNIYPQEKNLDIDTLYPSEDGKIENYYGVFSGNVPENRGTAILRAVRARRSQSLETQLYQEWECYSSDTDYSPNKYIRFGYFTGSNTPTWSAWQKLQRQIKYKEVTLTNITIGANGYYNIRSSFPSGMNNFLFASMYDFGSISSANALGVNGNGEYLFGTANATISSVTIRYFYYD